MFLDIYAIQNVPPCDMNRDDTGTPKTAIYGGYLRSRVSSQAWKHAIRSEFPKMVDASKLGVRTKRAVSLIEEEICQIRPDLENEAEELATGIIKVTGVKIEKSKRSGSEKGAPVSQYLIFISRSEIYKLARIAIETHDAGESIEKHSAELKKKVSKAFHGTQAIDIALFGRMLADAPALNTDASCQVAHAISVDKMTQEYDYFAAVDDLAASDNAGAAMLDTIGFNSTTLYRYATVCLDSLKDQLGDSRAAVEGVRAFLKAFVESMPTGKQNTFANRTLPNAVLVALRAEQPINGVAAFEDPVRPKDGTSISHQAEERLASKLNDIAKVYGMQPAASWWFAVDGGGDKLAEFGTEVSVNGMLDEVSGQVLHVLEDETEGEA